MMMLKIVLLQKWFQSLGPAGGGATQRPHELPPIRGIARPGRGAGRDDDREVPQTASQRERNELKVTGTFT